MYAHKWSRSKTSDIIRLGWQLGVRKPNPWRQEDEKGDSVFLRIRVGLYYFHSKLNQTEWNATLYNILKLMILWHNLESSDLRAQSSVIPRTTSWFKYCLRWINRKTYCHGSANNQIKRIVLCFSNNFKLYNMETRWRIEKLLFPSCHLTSKYRDLWIATNTRMYYSRLLYSFHTLRRNYKRWRTRVNESEWMELYHHSGRILWTQTNPSGFIRGGKCRE